MMKDPRMNPETNPMPFDGKRMIFGGFEPIPELGGVDQVGRSPSVRAEEGDRPRRH